MHRIQAYITLAIILIGGIVILYLPLLFYLKKQGISMIRQVSYLGLICSLFLIIFATLLFVPMNFKNHTINLIPFLWLKEDIAFQQMLIEKIPNIILFIPLGFFLPLVFKKLRSLSQILIYSFLVTFSVETIQYFIGRSCDIDDIITNLIGAILGYLIYVMMEKYFHHNKFWQKMNINKINKV